MTKLLTIFLLCIFATASYSKMAAPPKNLVVIPAKDVIPYLATESKKRPNDDSFFYYAGLIHLRAAQDISVSFLLTESNEINFNRLGGVWPKQWYDIENRWNGVYPSSEPMPYIKDFSEQESLGYDKNLNLALENFTQAVKINSINYRAAFGIGWVYEKQGFTDKAIKQYRIALNQAWKQEKHETWYPYIEGDTPPTFFQIGRALLKFLDEDKDAKEIADIKNKMQKINDNADKSIMT